MGIHRTVIRDAVHGDIFLDKTDMDIIDTREMQRLRGIKQLGTAYLVYPGAMHTRFSHSIGTRYVAEKILGALRSNGADISREDEEVVKAAALVHDVTHLPFGHTFEDERKTFPRHDRDRKRAEHFLTEGELGDALKDAGITKEVMELLGGSHPLSDIVSGTICADLLDYIRRDLYFTGIKGDYDDRVLRYFTLDGGRLALNMEKSGELRRDALSSIIDILRLRYVLTERVYYHHAKAASGAMISKAVELAIAEKDGLKKEDMYDMGDEDLISYLISREGGVKKLAEGVRYRKLYKRVYMVSGEKYRERFVPYHESPPANPESAMKNRESAEWVISSSLGLKYEDIIIYAPSINMQMKEADVPVKIPGNRGAVSFSSLSSEAPEIRSLMDNHRNLWKFYVFASQDALKRLGKERIKKACQQHFGVESDI